MKTLHLYLLRQCLATLGLTVLVFTFVLIAGNLLREILGLLVSGHISFWLVCKSLLLLIPFVLAFALPISMLMAGLMVIGRFSADQEYTAARSAGISLISLISPIIILAVVLTGLCAWFNLQISPASRVAYKKIFAEQMFNLASFIPEGRYVDFADEFVIYVTKVNGDRLEDIRFYQFRNGQKTLDVFAQKGKVVREEGQDHIRLVLNQARVLTQVSNAKQLLTGADTAVVAGDASSETDSAEWLPIYLEEYETEDIPLELGDIDNKVDISDMTLRQLLGGRQYAEERGLDTRPYMREIHHQAAFSFASLSFILVAIPLSLKTQRRETNISLALALIVILVYYSFFILGDALVGDTPVNARLWVLYWIPNILFQIIGIYMIWRANRGIG